MKRTDETKPSKGPSHKKLMDGRSQRVFQDHIEPLTSADNQIMKKRLYEASRADSPRVLAYFFPMDRPGVQMITPGRESLGAPKERAGNAFAPRVGLFSKKQIPWPKRFSSRPVMQNQITRVPWKIRDRALFNHPQKTYSLAIHKKGPPWWQMGGQIPFPVP
jgi:hypothetical protein